MLQPGGVSVLAPSFRFPVRKSAHLKFFVKLMKIASLKNLIHETLPYPGPRTTFAVETVASILERDLDATISFWWGLVEKEKERSRIPLPPEERTAHLPTLIRDVIVRLRLPRSAKAAISHAACDHGTLRRTQGYTVAMLVEESRILQVSIFHTLNNNLRTVDFSKLLLDVITIADEVDSQLKQAALCYVEPEALRVVA